MLIKRRETLSSEPNRERDEVVVRVCGEDRQQGGFPGTRSVRGVGTGKETSSRHRQCKEATGLGGEWNVMGPWKEVPPGMGWQKHQTDRMVKGRPPK